MRPSELTPERRAELLARYPTEGNQALAAEFGISAGAVAQLACNHNVRKTRETLSALNRGKRVLQGPSCAEQTLAAVKAAGRAGLSRAEAIARLPSLREGAVSNALDCLTGRGHMHRAGRRGNSRWFIDEADAKRHDLAPAACQPEAAPAPPPQQGPARREGPADDTAATRTEGRPVLGRTFTTDTPAEGLFTTLGAGQYLDDRPSPWVAAATRRA